jgi:hypothetical protein
MRDRTPQTCPSAFFGAVLTFPVKIGNGLIVHFADK